MSGNYVKVDLKSVKDKADKTIKYLNKMIGNRISNQNYVVIFLGEEHGNNIDQAVTAAILNAPPLVSNGHTRVIFERGLDRVYVPGVSFNSQRVEAVNYALNRKARSKVIADMAKDAFENHNEEVVYIVCGSAHAREIFDSLNKRFSSFTYISKLSCTD